MELNITVSKDADISAIVVFRNVETGRDSGEVVIDPGFVATIELADQDQLVIRNGAPSGGADFSRFVVTEAAAINGQGALSEAPVPVEPTLAAEASETPAPTEDAAEPETATENASA